MNVALALPSVTQAIGQTRLVELHRLSRGLAGRLVVKLESANPTGSIKDRVAVALVGEAEATGALRPGATLVLATSGNTGLALAHVGAARGYRVRLVVPQDWSNERIALLLYMGADVIRTPGFGLRAAIERAAEEAARIPGAVLLDQFSSRANVEVHRTTTAEEIWRDTGGQVAAFVAGVGTGGTVTGVALGLRARNPDVRVVAVEPARSAVLSGGAAGPHGIQGIGAGFVPPLFRRDLVDAIVPVSDEEAFAAAQELAREEGILAGVSSGASIAVARALANQPGMRGKLIVTTICDGGERYVTSPLAVPPPPAPSSTRRRRRRGGGP
jgi:cysteine synthase A